MSVHYTGRRRTLFTPEQYDDIFVLAERFRAEGMPNRVVEADGWTPTWPEQRPFVDPFMPRDRIRQAFERLEQGGGRTLRDPFMGTPIVKCDPTCLRGICRNAREVLRSLGFLEVSTVRCSGCIDCVMAEKDDEVPM